VVEMEEQDVGVPFVFAMPAGQASPFVEKEDDDDTSLSDVSGGRPPGGSTAQV